MNILLMPHLFYPRIGGVEIVVANLAKQFSYQGHKIEIVTSRLPKTLPESDFVDGIKVTRLPFRLPSSSIKSLFSFSVKGTYSIKKMISLARKSKFDLLNLHYVSGNALYALFLRNIARIPLITNIHGADIEDFSCRNKFNKYLVGRTLSKSARIIVNSNAMLRRVTEMFGEELLDKSVVIGNGIDLAEFEHLENTNDSLFAYVLGIGRFAPVKGFDLLIKAFSLVINRFPDLKLLLVGDGLERNRLENLSRDLGLQRSVVFHGFVKHKDVPKVLAGCECFVLPSRKEAFGIVGLEAMAAKKALIAMDVGGISDYLHHGKTGLLVRDHSPRSLADAIIFLLEHPNFARELGLNGRKMVASKYTWEIIANSYLDTFRSVL